MTKTCPDCKAEVLSTSQPNGTVTDAMVETAWAAIVGGDIAKICFNASINRADLETGLTAALAATPAVAQLTPDIERLAHWLSHYATCIVDDERCGRKMLEIVSYIRAATPAVGGEDWREALKPLAAIGLWQDRYPDGTDKLTDQRLQGYLTPDQVRAARAALAQPASPLRGREISFGYTNWRGETSHRHVRPISMRYGTSEYHKQAGWLMLSLDIDKNEQREFAMRDMVLVEPANEIALTEPPEQPAAAPGTREGGCDDNA